MRIESSTITMASARSYTAETTFTQDTIIRAYNGDALESARVSTATARIKQVEAEGGTAIFQTSADGAERTDQSVVDHAHTDSKPMKQKGQAVPLAQPIAVPSTDHWISRLDFRGNDFLRRLLDLLERFTGKKMSRHGLDLPQKTTPNTPFRTSAATATARYRATMAMAGSAELTLSANPSGGAVNGHWTRQVVQSGFVSGQENTAFTSQGTVVTADGRTLNFNISLEMSRSFESAFASISREEVYTDPLVINLDTDAASLSDVSFYFDLNCDGEAEELSALDSASGFLALDKNGDGEINNGSELFGALTGDGFAELARYDQDGNGWIDENDDVFSRLSVWTKCGGGEPQLLTLSEADVGAIFLGSQNTQYTLMDAMGEAGAMIRKTGVYLKESGQVGTVQHVDFKA